MKEYKFTLIGLALASIVFLVTFTMEIDLFEITIKKNISINIKIKNIRLNQET